MKPIPDEVVALRAEAAGQADVVTEPGEPGVVEAAGYLVVARNLVRGLGNGICVRAQVPVLTDPEVEALAGAVAELARVYDFANLDPRTAAWLGLGFAAIGIAGPRIAIVQARPRREAPKPEPASVSEPVPVEPPVTPEAVPASPDQEADKDARAFHGPA